MTANEQTVFRTLNSHKCRTKHGEGGAVWYIKLAAPQFFEHVLNICTWYRKLRKVLKSYVSK